MSGGTKINPREQEYAPLLGCVKLPLHTLPSLHGAKASEKCKVNAEHLVFLHGAGAPCHPGKQKSKENS